MKKLIQVVLSSMFVICTVLVMRIESFAVTASIAQIFAGDVSCTYTLFGSELRLPECTDISNWNATVTSIAEGKVPLIADITVINNSVTFTVKDMYIMGETISLLPKAAAIREGFDVPSVATTAQVRWKEPPSGRLTHMYAKSGDTLLTINSTAAFKEALKMSDFTTTKEIKGIKSQTDMSVTFLTAPLKDTDKVVVRALCGAFKVESYEHSKPLEIVIGGVNEPFTAEATEFTGEIKVTFRKSSDLAAGANQVANWEIIGGDAENLGGITAVQIDGNIATLKIKNGIMGVRQQYKVIAKAAALSKNENSVAVDVKVKNITKAIAVNNENKAMFYCFDLMGGTESLTLDRTKATDPKNWEIFGKCGAITSIKAVGDYLFEFTFEQALDENFVYHLRIKKEALTCNGSPSTCSSDKIYIYFPLITVEEKPIDVEMELGTVASIPPTYRLKTYQKLPNGLNDTKTKIPEVASDITIWQNGGAMKVGKQRVDYKSELILPAVLAGNSYAYIDKNDKKVKYSDAKTADVDMDAAWLKTIGKTEGKKFKWFVTELSVTNPTMAYTSTTVQAQGKEIASCTNGKLTASGKQLSPTKGRVWVFDECGQYGMAVFRVEIAPNVIYASEDFTGITFKDGKPATAEDKKKLKTTYDIYNDYEYHTFKVSGKTTLKAKDAKDRDKIFLTDKDHGFTQYQYDVIIPPNMVDYISAEIDGDTIYVTAENYVHEKKPRKAKFDVVCRQSQKKVTVTFNIKNPIVKFYDLVESDFLEPIANKDTTFTCTTTPYFMGSSGAVNKADIYVIAEDADPKAMYEALFDPVKHTYKKSSSAEYNVDGVTAKFANKNMDIVKIKVPKNMIGPYKLLFVTYTNKPRTEENSREFGYTALDFSFPPPSCYYFKYIPKGLTVKYNGKVIKSGDAIPEASVTRYGEFEVYARGLTDDYMAYGKGFPAMYFETSKATSSQRVGVLDLPNLGYETPYVEVKFAPVGLGGNAAYTIADIPDPMDVDIINGNVNCKKGDKISNCAPLYIEIRRAGTLTITGDAPFATQKIVFDKAEPYEHVLSGINTPMNITFSFKKKVISKREVSVYSEAGFYEAIADKMVTDIHIKAPITCTKSAWINGDITIETYHPMTIEKGCTLYIGDDLYVNLNCTQPITNNGTIRNYAVLTITNRFINNGRICNEGTIKGVVEGIQPLKGLSSEAVTLPEGQKKMIITLTDGTFIDDGSAGMHITGPDFKRLNWVRRVFSEQNTVVTIDVGLDSQAIMPGVYTVQLFSTALVKQASKVTITFAP